MPDIGHRHHQTHQHHHSVRAVALPGDLRPPLTRVLAPHVATPSSRSAPTRSTPPSAPASTWLITWPHVTCSRRSATSSSCASSRVNLATYTRRSSFTIKVLYCNSSIHHVPKPNQKVNRCQSCGLTNRSELAFPRLCNKQKSNLLVDSCAYKFHLHYGSFR